MWIKSDGFGGNQRKLFEKLGSLWELERLIGRKID